MEVLFMIFAGLVLIIGAVLCLLLLVCFPPLTLAVSIVVGFNIGLGWLSIPFGVGLMAIQFAMLDTN